MMCVTLARFLLLCRKSKTQRKSNSFQACGQEEVTTSPGSTVPPVFSPIVTATCRAGVMTVKVETLDNFLGVVQSRDYRKPECSR
jgi:hypothetical protein